MHESVQPRHEYIADGMKQAERYTALAGLLVGPEDRQYGTFFNSSSTFIGNP